MCVCPCFGSILAVENEDDDAAAVKGRPRVRRRLVPPWLQEPLSPTCSKKRVLTHGFDGFGSFWDYTKGLDCWGVAEIEPLHRLMSWAHQVSRPPKNHHLLEKRGLNLLSLH